MILQSKVSRSNRAIAGGSNWVEFGALVQVLYRSWLTIFNQDEAGVYTETNTNRALRVLC